MSMAGYSRPFRDIVGEQSAYVPLKKIHSPGEHIIDKTGRKIAKMGR